MNSAFGIDHGDVAKAAQLYPRAGMRRAEGAAVKAVSAVTGGGAHKKGKLVRAQSRAVLGAHAVARQLNKPTPFMSMSTPHRSW